MKLFLLQLFKKQTMSENKKFPNTHERRNCNEPQYPASPAAHVICPHSSPRPRHFLCLRLFKENLRHCIILLPSTLVCVLRRGGGKRKDHTVNNFLYSTKNIIIQYDRTATRHVDCINKRNGLPSLFTKGKMSFGPSIKSKQCSPLFKRGVPKIECFKG